MPVTIFFNRASRDRHPLEHPEEAAGGDQAPEPVVHRVPPAELGRQVPPRRSRQGQIQEGFEELPVGEHRRLPARFPGRTVVFAGDSGFGTHEVARLCHRQPRSRQRIGTSRAYKTLVATWRPAGGSIRVVLVDEPKGRVAFFCSDPTADVANVPGHVAARFGLEITFGDVKEVVGAGQQQVRSVAGNVGAVHPCAWAFTMTEAWACGRAAENLIGHRSASPWDDGARRPSHADKRRAWRRELLGYEIRAVLRPGLTEPEIRPPRSACWTWPRDREEVAERAGA